MDTESILVPIFPAPYDPLLTPHKYTYLDGTLEQYVESEIFRQDHKSPLRTAKCVLAGPPTSGKSSLIRKLGTNGLIISNHKSAIKIDYWIQNFEILGVPFKLQIWDTIDSKNVSRSFYRDAQVIMLTFDLTKPQMLKEVKDFAEEILKASHGEQALIFLVGTKIDLVTVAQCRSIEKDIAKLVKELDAEYWPVSSITGRNLKQMFARISALVFLRMLRVEIEVMEAFKMEERRHSVLDQSYLSVKKKRTTCLKCSIG